MSVSANTKRDASTLAGAPPPVRRTKMSFSEVRELEGLPGKIAALENEQAALQAQFSHPVFYSKSPQIVTSFRSRENEIGAELEPILAVGNCWKRGKWNPGPDVSCANVVPISSVIEVAEQRGILCNN